MLRKLIVAVTLMLLANSASAAPRQVTLYSDAALLELEAVARKGVVEITLPARIADNSLRIKPLEGSTIGKVDLLPPRAPEKSLRELEALTEQKSRLEDRMKALEARESIFAAAAKSQSAKAPKKSKANPDPMLSIRQGTEFAIAQLEAVITARRRTEQELKKIEARIAVVRRQSASGQLLKVQVAPSGGKIRITALMQEGGWKPRYEIRLNNDHQAAVAMFADSVTVPEGFAVSISSSKISDSARAKLFQLLPGGQNRLAEWRFPLENEQLGSGPVSSFSLGFRNSTDLNLPAGEALLYSQGEFIGTTVFPGGAPATLISVTSNR
jgi:hypothetical protein